MTSSVVLGTARVRQRGRRVLPMTTCEALTPRATSRMASAGVVPGHRVPRAAELLGEPAQRREALAAVAR